MTATPTSQAVRRAPRLAPHERLAPYITRVGRFRAVDPARGRELPDFARIVALLGWATLLIEAFRRARAASRDTAQAGPVR